MITVRREQGYAHMASVRGHSLAIDEPHDKGGSDTGPSPEELLAVSLASCTAITIEMYAGRKGWDLGAVEVDVEYAFEAPGRARYEVVVKLPAKLDDEQLDRLRAIVGKCPVHRTLTGDVTIEDRLELTG